MNQNESIMFIADSLKLQGFPQVFDDSHYHGNLQDFIYHVKFFYGNRVRAGAATRQTKLN